MTFSRRSTEYVFGIILKVSIFSIVAHLLNVAISGHKPSALVERYYIVRPMDMLRETLQEYEDWILQQVRNGIN